jgi:hypothetical protein
MQQLPPASAQEFGGLGLAAGEVVWLTGKATHPVLTPTVGVIATSAIPAL